MQIQSIHQLYLMQLLPRGPGWHDYRVAFLGDSRYEAYVTPRNLDEALFPSEIDEDLSRMSYTLGSGGLGGSVERTIASRCVDRLRVDIVVNLDQAPNNWLEFERTALWRATYAANRFLRHVRIASGVSDLQLLEVSWSQGSGYDLLFPHTVMWLDVTKDEWLAAVYESGANAAGDSGGLRTPGTGTSDMDQISRSLTGGEPALTQVLLVDAKQALAGLDSRGAILSAATAAEAASSAYIEAKNAEHRSDVRRILGDRYSSFASKRYAAIPEVVSEKSLETDDLISFALVEQVYRERNGLMHNGTLTRATTGLLPEDQLPAIAGMVRAVKKAVLWIEGL